MEGIGFYGINFFPGEPVCCHIKRLDSHTTTITFNINSKGPYSGPKITFFMYSDQEVINFKNSVIQTYERYLRDEKKRKEKLENE